MSQVRKLHEHAEIKDFCAIEPPRRLSAEDGAIPAPRRRSSASLAGTIIGEVRRRNRRLERRRFRADFDSLEERFATSGSRRSPERADHGAA
jgi:hypothetical protein